jgi:hypothetical protein
MLTSESIFSILEKNGLNGNVDVHLMDMVLISIGIVTIHFKRIRISWNVTAAHDPLLIHVIPGVTILFLLNLKMSHCIQTTF